MKLIDADKLKKDILDLKDCYNGFSDTYDKACIIGVIDEQPSVQSERKKGHWINHRNDDGHNIADCSICGHPIQWFDGDETPKFCCMCGSKIVGLKSDGFSEYMNPPLEV